MSDVTDRLAPQDLHDSRQLLSDLLAQVSEEEGVLSGGTKLGVGGNALRGLMETKVTFGNPGGNLVRLDEDLFGKLGVELTEVRRRQMRESFDFYYLTLSVSLQPARGAQFTRLECRLTFGPRGPGEPVVESVFPSGEWKELLQWGGGMKLGLDGNLDWGAEADLPAAVQGQLPARQRAGVHGAGGLKGFLAIPDLSYKLGRAEVVATGPGDAECFWRLENATLRQSQVVQFAVVFKVPRGTASVELTGLVAAEPSFQWLAANLRDVFAHLAEGLRAIFHRDPADRRGRERLPVGDHETWRLKLPS